MTLAQYFPSWMPWWAQLAVVVLGLLCGLLFLAMPFSVFGVKTRLDIIEARLDEIQGEIRSLALRLPEPTARRMSDAAFEMRSPVPSEYGGAERIRPPIPPAAQEPPRRSSEPAGRNEPRLYS